MLRKQLDQKLYQRANDKRLVEEGKKLVNKLYYVGSIIDEENVF
jgi:hypothetical protein